MKTIECALPVAMVGAALALVASAQSAMAAPPMPFKQTNIHFETNSSACDMGIQMSFDTDGITEGEVEDPNERVVFTIGAVEGTEEVQDVTESFHERVEPPVMELEEALGCDPSDDAVSLDDLLDAWPAGTYEFEGLSGGVEFEGVARLSHRIPAGPVILTPSNGAIVAHDAALPLRWQKVTTPILPSLGPVEVVGYHIVVVDVTSPILAPGKTKTALDADLARNETTFHVPKQYLEPGRIYEFEVLATEKSGNQTITEGGVFCTPPILPGNCVKP